MVGTMCRLSIGSLIISQVAAKGQKQFANRWKISLSYEPGLYIYCIFHCIRLLIQLYFGCLCMLIYMTNDVMEWHIYTTQSVYQFILNLGQCFDITVVLFCVLTRTIVSLLRSWIFLLQYCFKTDQYPQD